MLINFWVRPLLFFFILAMTMPCLAHVGLKTRFAGETFHPGDQVMIEWEVLVEHDPIDWDLLFSMDGGESWEPIEEGLPLYQLTYTWVAPDFDSEKMLIRIVQDNEVSLDYADMSDTFSIVSSQATAVHDVEHINFKSSVFPNPAFSEVNIALSLVQSGRVVFAIYDLSGHLLEEIRRSKLGRGDYVLKAHADNLPDGVLLLRTTVNGESKMEPFIKLP